MDNSILQDVKMYIGINPDAEDPTFDNSIVMFINSGIDDLARIGLGNIGSFRLENRDEKWSDYLIDYPSLISSVKSYICIYTRLHFDTPQSSLQSALEEQLRKLEFTIQTEIEQMSED